MAFETEERAGGRGVTGWCATHPTTDNVIDIYSLRREGACDARLLGGRKCDADNFVVRRDTFTRLPSILTRQIPPAPLSQRLSNPTTNESNSRAQVRSQSTTQLTRPFGNGHSIHANTQRKHVLMSASVRGRQKTRRALNRDAPCRIL